MRFTMIDPLCVSLVAIGSKLFEGLRYSVHMKHLHMFDS